MLYDSGWRQEGGINRLEGRNALSGSLLPVRSESARQPLQTRLGTRSQRTNDAENVPFACPSKMLQTSMNIGRELGGGPRKHGKLNNLF